MDCTQAREALSAFLDGEATEVPRTDLDTHLGRCAACRHFLDEAGTIDALAHAVGNGSGRITDVTARVLAAARAERHRPDPWSSSLRLGLVGVAVAQLVLAVPGLVYGTDEGAPIHVAHEVGAWDLALAIGFLFAAWRPLRAIGLLPFAHLLELVGTALLYLLMAPRYRSRRALRLA